MKYYQMLPSAEHLFTSDTEDFQLAELRQKPTKDQGTAYVSNILQEDEVYNPFEIHRTH